jgi:hypothetical protein
MASLTNSPARRCNASTGPRLNAACDVERRKHVYNFKPREVQLLDACVTLSPELQESIQTKLHQKYRGQHTGGDHE